MIVDRAVFRHGLRPHQGADLADEQADQRIVAEADGRLHATGAWTR